MSDGIKVNFGGGTEADTFRTVFAPLVGWVLEVNGKDYTLMTIEDGIVDAFGIDASHPWVPTDEIGFWLKPFIDGENVPDYKRWAVSEEDMIAATFIPWSDIEKVVIH